MIISANTQSACHLITTLCTATITVALFEWLLIMKSLEDLWSHLINCLAGVDWPFSPHTLDYILCSISGAWPPQRWSSLLSPVFTQFPSSHPGHQHTRCHTRLVISWHLIEENKFFSHCWLVYIVESCGYSGYCGHWGGMWQSNDRTQWFAQSQLNTSSSSVKIFHFVIFTAPDHQSAWIH